LFSASLPSRHPSLATLIATSFLSAVVLFAAVSVSSPGDALGATVAKVAMCGASLRTSAYTSARVRTTIGTGTRVSVTAKIYRGSWRTRCAGKVVFGRTWYRISAIGGKSVRSLYGVSYLYAQTSRFTAFVPPPVTRYAACRVNLRTGPSSAETATTVLPTDTPVLVTTSVAGSAWSATCGDNAVAGSSWYRISMVDGASVASLYGVPYLYAAAGLFNSTVTPSTAASIATPTPTPAIVAEPVPTPTPSASPTPTPPPTPTPAPGPAPMSRTTEGVVVSHWQGTIDWTRVAGAGKRFVYMKASEGTTFVDPNYGLNRPQARAAGMYVGAYHFAQPSASVLEAVAQADHFIDTAGPTRGDLLPVLDLERTGSLSQSVLTAWVQAYVERIYQRIGVHAVIYCSPNFWKTYMGDTTWFAVNGYDVLWIAHWTAASAPTVPGGAWGGNGWTFWQYTSDGTVPGISGRVDLNRYNGTDFTKVLIP